VLAPAAVTEAATAAGVTVSATEAVVLKGFTGPVDVVRLTGR
jgi:hypothetical protein